MLNSRSIHYRVTDNHIFPNNSEKMRNHLAEDMLNGDMLHLMKCYQVMSYYSLSVQYALSILQIIHIKTGQTPSSITVLFFSLVTSNACVLRAVFACLIDVWYFVTVQSAGGQASRWGHRTPNADIPNHLHFQR